MPMTVVTMIVVMVVIVTRGGLSMVAVMIAHRMTIIAAIVSHALVALWSLAQSRRTQCADECLL
jgi:hypothetical protein